LLGELDTVKAKSKGKSKSKDKAASESAANAAQPAKGAESDEFYRTKIQTAEFYFDRMLPRANSHRTSALASTRSVMQIDKEHFAFV
jgi:protein-tyrosine-phosphatase